MRVSVTYDLRNPPQWRVPFDRFYREALDHMAFVEELGFDGIWLQQHHFEEAGYGPPFAAFAGALAVKTQRVRVGSYIKILPLYHPLLVAEEMAVLDNLLGGRLDVGVGVGHRMLEFKALGVPHKQRPSRMEEGVEVMRRAWTEDRVTFEGRRFSFQDVEVQPKPMQKPHPPLWMAARTVAAAQRAGRLRCHLLPGTNDPEVFRAYAAALRDVGEDPAKYQVTMGLSVTLTREDPEKVWQRLRPHSEYRWQFYDTIIDEFGDPPLRAGYSEVAGQAGDAQDRYRDRELIGDPDTILRAIERLRETWSWDGLGVTEVIVRTPPPGVPLEEHRSSFELFAREIMPVLRRW
ncbi:MAG: LLM class flavin-dependent oxidoreductase [Chloroflexi bacterium]|nr:LLM class flavin-dependent oxidoreductase [Chloroflexota bacterium]